MLSKNNLIYRPKRAIISLNKNGKGKEMLKNLFKRVKSQKGMSGVLVALLLVIVGVGLVAGIDTWLDAKKTQIQQAGDNAITNAL